MPKPIPTKKVTVITHSPCADGFTASWVIRSFLKTFKKKDVIYHPGSYNTVPPEVAGREVIIADFSYPREILLKMKKEASSLVVIDHHATAAKDLEGLKFCTFDMKRSGAGLTWDYFFPWKVRPWLVDYVEDRDLWNWKLPNSKEVSAALDSYPLDFATWDKIAKATPEYLANQGSHILRYEDQVIDRLLKGAREVELAGYKVLAVNSPTLQSQLGSKLAEGRPFGVVYRQNAEGLWSYSLRSTDFGVDVSIVAELFSGGGGHPKSSAFTSPTLLF